MKIRDLKISLMMTFIAVIVAAGFVGYFFVSESIADTTKIGSQKYNEIMMIKDLKADILPPPEYIIESYLAAMKYFSEYSPDKKQVLKDRITSLKDEFLARHAYWDGALKNEQLRKLLLEESYEAAVYFYDVYFNEATKAVESGDRIALSNAQAKLTMYFEKHRAKIDEAVIIADQLALDAESSANDRVKIGQIELIGLSVLSLVIIVTLILVIARAIRKPIEYVTTAIGELSEGKLSIEIDDKYISKSETGQISLALKHMIAQLRGYVSEISDILGAISGGDLTRTVHRDYVGDFAPIKEALQIINQSLNETFAGISAVAGQVNGGATIVSSGAQTLASAATQQASSVEELSSSITQISGDIRRNAENIGLSTTYIGEAGAEVDTSNANMSALLQAMNDINASSAKISAIIKIIDDISFQTNILALNAAVEAARAGQAGRGFSVVAEEVRRLASKSADAASQTADLITASVTSVKQGLRLAEETAASLKAVAEKAGLVVQANDQINEASHAQSRAISEIENSLQLFSSTVQTISATAEENAAASEELSSQATILFEQARQFKTTGDLQDISYSAAAFDGMAPALIQLTD